MIKWLRPFLYFLLSETTPKASAAFAVTYNSSRPDRIRILSLPRLIERGHLTRPQIYAFPRERMLHECDLSDLRYRAVNINGRLEQGKALGRTVLVGLATNL